MKCPTKRLPWCFALDHVNYEMSNFQLARLLLPWNIILLCGKQNRGKGVATYPKLRNLAMNGFAVLANSCAEEDVNATKQFAVHSPVRMC